MCGERLTPRLSADESTCCGVSLKIDRFLGRGSACEENLMTAVYCQLLWDEKFTNSHGDLREGGILNTGHIKLRWHPPRPSPQHVGVKELHTLKQWPLLPGFLSFVEIRDVCSLQPTFEILSHTIEMARNCSSA